MTEASISTARSQIPSSLFKNWIVPEIDVNPVLNKRGGGWGAVFHDLTLTITPVKVIFETNILITV